MLREPRHVVGRCTSANRDVVKNPYTSDLTLPLLALVFALFGRPRAVRGWKRQSGDHRSGMLWPQTKRPPDLRLLLENGRKIGVLPAAARARVLSRARAALAAGVATRPVPSRAPLGARWAAAGLAFVGTAALGVAAYELGLRGRPTAPIGGLSQPADPFAPHWSAGAEPVLNLLAGPLVEAMPTRSRAGAIRKELRLLEQARAALAKEDFAQAIQLVAEHTRRFRTGRLVEEREALRIEALAGLGRRNDARRAAAEFETRFPNSPLLLTVSQMADLAP